MIFSDELINWYRTHKRDLPWRNTNDAYLIWLSEIILQQTRVEQGMPYYFKFSEQYPTVGHFAAASEDDILRLWQGLGYYSRGRNMLKTAKIVRQNFKGIFPNAYADLIKLTGIGDYTAAAISSFSTNEAKAVVDGNVYRLLARYFGIETPINTTKGKKQFQEIADELINPKNAGEHNQAMIEFGALQCKPKNPDCEVCPFVNSCYAYQHKRVTELPVKLKKLKIKERYFYFILSTKNNQILIKRRGNEDIWAGLHDLPSIEFTEPTSLQQLINHVDFKSWTSKESVIHSISDQIKHILTHQRIYARFIHIDHLKPEIIAEKGWFWININELEQYGQPKLIFEFLKNFFKLR
ncbi:A/G-specific adenine glycosylase [Pelobium sp.]|nr:A/G-specific adenine glycosylase [Pelobium sp.]MDA9554722.1 A/G-specific adenine glycosylase [Pelobium sp.]